MELGLRDLGRRHRGYGVPAGHYPVFRQAFLDAVRVILGDRHTTDVDHAWAAVIDLIIEAMQSGAHAGTPDEMTAGDGPP